MRPVGTADLSRRRGVLDPAVPARGEDEGGSVKGLGERGIGPRPQPVAAAEGPVLDLDYIEVG